MRKDVLVKNETAAIVDKLKFTVSRVGPDEANKVFDRLMFEVRQNAIAAGHEEVFMRAYSYVRNSVYHSGGKGRSTFAAYSMEVTGMPAHMIFQWLPVWSLGFLKYFHVKGYHAGIDSDAYLHLKNAATNAPMFREITTFSPKQRRADGGPPAKLPGMRIGAPQSDQQVVVYMAGSEPFGTETRLSGDKLKRLIGVVKDHAGDNPQDRLDTLKSLAYVAMGEGHDYVRRLKEQCGMTDVVVAGPLMTYEELSALWGWVDMTNYDRPLGQYTDKGFPVWPVFDNGTPVKGAVDIVTGERINGSEVIDETGELE